MAIIGYARVSTEEQNLDLQLDALRAAGCARVFEDFGVSAVAKRREGFDDAMAALRSGDTFVIWKMDRAFRSLRQALDTLDLFRARGVAFRSLTENFDTSTPMGEAMYQIRNVFAELERKLIAERVRAGMAAAKLRGRTFGRPRKLTKKRLKTARRLLKQKSYRQVARRMRISERTLRRRLKR